MTSRLDRLFILLESGSSAVTRRAAAKQIGEVQKLYPHELHALLNRLIGYLHSPSWETRIAAAEAVQAVLLNVPEWRPDAAAAPKRHDAVKKETPSAADLPPDEENSCQSSSSASAQSSLSAGDAHRHEQRLSFGEFNLEHVLHKGARLIGSAGSEFDLQDDAVKAAPGDSSTDRLSRQRALLNEKLGLTQALKLGVNLTDMITDDDVMASTTESAPEEKVPVEHILSMAGGRAPPNGQPLSCREMNRAKRKARQNPIAAPPVAATSSSAAAAAAAAAASVSRRSSTASNNGNSNSSAGDEPERKKPKADAQRPEVFYNLNEPVPDATGAWAEAVHWPLEPFCGRLYVDLFNPKWEVRHGAARGLRELINHGSAGAGKSAGMSSDEMEEQHRRWLEDAALRLLCVLCLDRFGDFVSDQVVAPVRETCAQVLGTIVKEMAPPQVHHVVQLLLTLTKQREWEVRHGGLLGLKYVFVVRPDLLQLYLPQTISDILLGLFDACDDVGAVAAATLIPVAAFLPQLLTPTQVSSIVKMLWDLLLDQDELTSACSSFMGLLAAILSLPDASAWLQMEAMSALVPRLWPFLSHSTSSVRRSTLVTLETLTSRTYKRESATPEAPAEDAAAMPALDMSFDSKDLKLNGGVVDWQSRLLQEALRHVYQRILIEPQREIQALAGRVWTNLIENANLDALLHAACPLVASWICLAMQPPRLAFDPAILIFPTAAAASAGRQRQRYGDDLGGTQSPALQKLFLGGSEATPADVRERNVMRARITAARALGALSHYLVQPAPGVAYTADIGSPTDCYTKVLLGYLNSRSAVQRLVCGLIVAFWAQADPAVRPGPPNLQEKLRSCVGEGVYYDEAAISLTRLHQEAHDFIATLRQYKVPLQDFTYGKILTLDQIRTVGHELTANLARCPLKPKVLDTLLDRRRALQASFQQTTLEQTALNVAAQSALAAAIASLRCLPEKLNPVVKPLMESVKREECPALQELSAEFLVQLMATVADRTPCPNGKIITNLCTLLKSDTAYTPTITRTARSLRETPPPESADADCVYYGILTLSRQQSAAGGGATATRGPGRPPMNEVPTPAPENGVPPINEAEQKQRRIQRVGAACAVAKLCQTFGDALLEKAPVCREILFERIALFVAAHPDMEALGGAPIDERETNDLVTSLQLIETAAPHMAASLHPRLFGLLPQFAALVTHPLKAVRHMTARCVATLAGVDALPTMDFVVNELVGLLRVLENVIQRQGAVEAIECVVDQLQIKVVPYIVLLVLPLLGCMSDSNEAVRLLATHSFATLIQLMPLDAGARSEGNVIKCEELQARKARDREFLDYLFAPKTIPDYRVPVALSVQLRSYQQAGVNWLWFLNKYSLHGILCDDMGLGKTLQTICILAGDHHQRAVDGAAELPSLVVCPPTLTGHWVYELDKFLGDERVLRPLHYVGLPLGREKLRCQIGPCNLVVASYDTVRKDIDYLAAQHWNYVVLDEGHIIKNGKTKSSKAIKMLRANHRLILSGTPIQNNVLELWSLFDFLMPGFLGTEKQFVARYSRPILASRDSKSSAKEQEAGVLAMEALHRQVLPFLLRRVKEDVLKDLPPKITQDLLCDLSPLQERLYEDFSRTHLSSNVKDCLEGGGVDVNAKTHIFNALRYLQNVCNHPKLVLTPKHPQYPKIAAELAHVHSSLSDIEHSAKLPALKQLLLDCGIGVQTETVSPHRALIFCQLKAMLNIVEQDLLRQHLPSVTYLRLDGGVPASQRQEIVNTFNSDPSIDVLLLTTQVGGIGLNLTGADTVIFVEHDWNPMKDLQAMDRAHRIGQRKVVNVYRLITRKSLEEKIMGLQKFKILTANTIVSPDNASLETMATGQILELFNLQESKARNGGGEKGAPSSAAHGGPVSMQSAIENLPDLWSEQQYDEEYDLSNYVQTLKK